MKIELSQSGGYAGETIKLKEISSDKISPEAKTKLDALLNEADFFNIKENEQSKEVGADFLTYKLKVNKSKDQHNEVTFGDLIDDSSFGRLVAYIKSL